MKDRIDTMRERLVDIDHDMADLADLHDEPNYELEQAMVHLGIEAARLRCDMYRLLKEAGQDPAAVLQPHELPSQGDSARQLKAATGLPSHPYVTASLWQRFRPAQY